MKIASRALSLLVVVFAAGCGDDGKSPRIKSFAASSQSLPEGGADVTFTWDVTREKTVELLPFPGLVTGSSATVNVAEPTTFTLLAKNKDGSARKKLSIAIGEPFTVNATLVTFSGAPAPNVQVFIDEEILITDENGEFSLENVIPPYDIGFVSTDPGGPNFGGGTQLLVGVYQGVTRPDPRVMCNVCSPASQPQLGTVSGTLSGGVGFPYPAGTPNPPYQTFVTVTGLAVGEAGDSVDPTTGDYSIDVDWRDGESQPVSISALEFSNVSQTVFSGYAHGSATVTNSVVTDADLTLAPVATNHITGALSAPWEIIGAYVGGWVDLGVPSIAPPGSLAGFVLEPGERVELPGAVISTNFDWSLAVPGIADVTHGIYASANGANGESAYYLRSNIATTVTTLDVELPDVTHLLTPVNNAVVGAGTVFSLSPVADGTVYGFSFYSAGGPFAGGTLPSMQVFVVTNSSTATFPDLGILGSPADGRQFQWGGSTYEYFGSVDGVVENGFAAIDDSYAGSYSNANRFFTYQPETTTFAGPAHREHP